MVQEETLVGQNDTYLLVREHKHLLARGKNALVWKGISTKNQVVVIKEFKPKDVPALFLEDRDGYLDLFKPEGLCKITDVVFGSHTIYFIRDFVDSFTLEEIMNNKKLFKLLSDEDKLQIAKDILTALNELHAQKIYHGDIKPANIFFNIHSKEVKLLDLGQAFYFGKKPPKKQNFTMVYSSPEHVLKIYALMHEQVDIFSFGIVLYELFSGAKPYKVSHAFELLNLQLSSPIVKPKHVTNELWEIISKMIYKKQFRVPPNQLPIKELYLGIREAQLARYQSCNEVLEDLKSIR